jgi:hypothetical protein
VFPRGSIILYYNLGELIEVPRKLLRSGSLANDLKGAFLAGDVARGNIAAVNADQHPSPLILHAGLNWG